MYIRDKRSPVPKNETVSRVMSANRAKNTRPELLLRQALWHAGARGYRIYYKIRLASLRREAAGLVPRPRGGVGLYATHRQSAPTSPSSQKSSRSSSTAATGTAARNVTTRSQRPTSRTPIVGRHFLLATIYCGLHSWPEVCLVLEKPTVVDLFSGVGGFSLGAARAGFKVLAAVENDPIAIASHTKNFPKTIHLEKDIRKLNGPQLLKAIGLNVGELTGLIGGPPCQGFSNIGRRNGNDGRNHLFGHFFRLVDQVRPAFFLAENVPGIMSDKYDKMRRNALAKIPDCYTVIAPFKAKASEYGAPTTRTRVFFFGYDSSKFDSAFDEKDFDPPFDAETITVAVALDGLPVGISEDWQKGDAEWLEIAKKNGTSFMTKVTGEVPDGVGDKFALKEYRENSRTSGCQGTKHLPTVIQRFSELMAGQTDETSRAVRLDPNGLCPTLRAGTGREKGSYQAIRPIHFSEPRVITPREAARLQGFPDWFVFHSTKWHSFRQIGNSVSPFVAECLLSVIRTKLNSVSL